MHLKTTEELDQMRSVSDSKEQGACLRNTTGRCLSRDSGRSSSKIRWPCSLRFIYRMKIPKSIYGYGCDDLIDLDSGRLQLLSKKADGMATYTSQMW